MKNKLKQFDEVFKKDPNLLLSIINKFNEFVDLSVEDVKENSLVFIMKKNYNTNDIEFIN